VWCWGNNSYAAVGQGAASGAQRTPFRLEALGTDNQDISPGQDSSCVKKNDGKLVCWGSFGDGTGWDRVRSATAFDVFGTDWKQLALHTAACVVTADSGVACWGFGEQKAVRIEGFGSDVVQVSISHDTVCAVKQSGSVMCGRLSGAAPVSVKGIEGAVQVSTGGALESDSAPWGRVMASTKDGTAYWALGGKSAQRMTQAGNDVAEVYIGETTASEHMFAAGTRSNGILSWGTNRCGALGDGLGGNGDTSHDHRDVLGAPGHVKGIDAYLQLALGHEHGCAILKDHTLWCWGRNAEGQIGSGAKDTTCDSGTASPNQPTPVQIQLCP
jgi:alpha-tubulin suppressor-like RCC1 family protein